MTAETHAGGRERAPRVHRFLSGALYSTRLGSVPIIIRDLARGGIGGRCDATLIPGEVITILIPHADALMATVIWAKGERFGAEFAEPIDPETIRTKASPAAYSAPHMFRPSISHRRPGFHSK
jgi:hypothetical protein